MGRWMFAICAAGLLQGCGSYDGTLAGDPGREIFGVTAYQPKQGENVTPVATASAQRKLDWEESQICSLGALHVRQDVEPGDPQKDIVDRLDRCQPYELSIFGVSLAHLVPTVPITYNRTN